MRPEEPPGVSGVPVSVERARHQARVFLAALAPAGSPRTADVLLVVSELVTNALRHAGGLAAFELRAGAGTVTVTVADGSPERPRAVGSGVAEPGGFGWPIVQRLSRDVRVTLGPAGKTVEAVLPFP